MQSSLASKEHRPTQIPKTYGESMLPLDIEALLGSLPAPLDSHPLVRRLVKLVDVTTRAEKISDPTTWKEAEQQAWDAGDYEQFSRLRGYTETEIEQFNEYLKAVQEVDQTLGEDTAIFVVYQYNLATQPYVKTPAQILSGEAKRA